MTLRVNPEFATILGAALATNTSWSTAFKNGLGATRRVICKIAPAGTAQENVYTAGTKFRDAAITGTMVISGGIVTDYGVTSNLTTSLAADLTAGVAILRIEGGGNWVEGTLGLVGSGCDFVLPVNPTATNSIAVLPNLRIKPPPFLNSGTGFAAPALDADAPAYLRFRKLIDPANPTESRVYLNTRIENWNFTDQQIADAMGDVRITQSTDMVTYGSAKHGDFEFGFTMFSMNSAANGTENKTLHQIVGLIKPTDDPSGNWPRYPSFGGYKKGTRTLGTVAPIVPREYGISKTFPPPFIVDVCRADGFVLGTMDMPMDHSAINNAGLNEFFSQYKPMRLKMHCGQVLFWESATPKLNPNRSKLVSGIDPRALRPSIGKEKAAYGGVYTPYTFSNGTIGIEHWYAADKWPMAMDPSLLYAKPSQDPYLYNQTANGESAPWRTPPWAVTFFGLPSSEAIGAPGGISLMQGWGYEPGSYCLHNHNTGPGGVRIDRSVIPGPIAIHLTDPTFVHLRDQTPITEMVSHWNKGYFNHGYHYTLDVRTGETLPLDELVAGKWGFCRTYYLTQGDSTTSGGVEYAVPVFAVRDPTDHPDEPHWGYFTDENYSMPWNGYAIDNLHDYTTPYYAAALYSSPAHAFALKHRYIAHLLVQNDNSVSDPIIYDIATRAHAWLLHHEVHMWKMASDHRFGVSRDIPFNRLVGLFNTLNRDLYVPLYVNNDQSIFYRALRNLGINIRYQGGFWYCQSFGLQYYMGGVLAQLRTTGLWTLLWNHSTTVRNGMIALLKMLDTGSIAYLLQTNGRYWGSTYNGAPFFGLNNTSQTGIDLATSWADWINRIVVDADKTPIDLFTKADGSYRLPDTAQALTMQWVKIRKDYFGDIACDYDLDAAVAKVEAWYASIATRIASQQAGGTSLNSLRLADWHIPPGYAFLKPPVDPLA